MHGFISGLSILFHWSIFLSLCQYHISWWLWLCSRVWSQAGWFLQVHSSFSRLLWLFEVFCISIQNYEIICCSSVKSTVGSLIGLPWIHRLLRVVYSFSLYWFFWPMKMIYLSIYLCHLWFLSSVFCSFLYIGLLFL